MKNTEFETNDCSPAAPAQLCAGRREFLTRSVAGGVAIALGGATFISRAALADDGNGNTKTDGAADAATAGAPPKSQVNADEVLIKPSDFPALAQVGGFVTLDTTAGKIVVARVEENKFVAVGAVCTHKGGPIEYDKGAKEFYCPWHKSRFDLDGAVLKGPARTALPHYQEETATVIKLS